MPLEPSSKPVLTPADVAEMFAVTPDAVRTWADDGKLPSFRTPGGSRRFRREDVEAFLRAEPTDGEALDQAAGQ